MVRKAARVPARKEIVIGKITKVNPFSVSVKLLEYPEVEGMVHISEVARKWIKDIREFVKVGQQIVAKVMKVEDKVVMLSMKRVSKAEADAKLKEFKREQRAEKMLELVAKEMGISLDKAYEKIGFKLQEEFGEMWVGFTHALTERGRKLLLKRGLPKKYVDVLAKIAEKSMAIKEVELKGYIQLSCTAPDGINVIKSALAPLQKSGIDIKYISAPKYLLVYRTTDAKRGEKFLTKKAEGVIQAIQKRGGSGSFELIKS